VSRRVFQKRTNGTDVLFDALTEEILALVVVVILRPNNISNGIAIIRAIPVCVREGWWW
jgi:hypothetical protein